MRHSRAFPAVCLVILGAARAAAVAVETARRVYVSSEFQAAGDIPAVPDLVRRVNASHARSGARGVDASHLLGTPAAAEGALPPINAASGR